MKKIILASLMVTPLLGLSMMPPKYLSVPDFKNCLSTKQVGTMKQWCLPSSKPLACPESSWNELESNEDKLESCSSKAKHDDYHDFKKVVDIANPNGKWVGAYIKHLDDKGKDVGYVNRIVNERCNLQGSLEAGNYSFELKTSWCINAARSIIGAEYNDRPLKEGATFTNKNNYFYINNHTINQGEKNDIN